MIWRKFGVRYVCAYAYTDVWAEVPNADNIHPLKQWDSISLVRAFAVRPLLALLSAASCQIRITSLAEL